MAERQPDFGWIEATPECSAVLFWYGQIDGRGNLGTDLSAVDSYPYVLQASYPFLTAGQADAISDVARNLVQCELQF